MAKMCRRYDPNSSPRQPPWRYSKDHLCDTLQETKITWFQCRSLPEYMKKSYTYPTIWCGACGNSLSEKLAGVLYLQWAQSKFSPHTSASGCVWVTGRVLLLESSGEIKKLEVNFGEIWVTVQTELIGIAKASNWKIKSWNSESVAGHSEQWRLGPDQDEAKLWHSCDTLMKQSLMWINQSRIEGFCIVFKIGLHCASCRSFEIWRVYARGQILPSAWE